MEKESELEISGEDDNEIDEVTDAAEPKNAKGGSAKKKKKSKKKKHKKNKIPKDMVMNENGEIVPAREYLLEKTLKSTTESLHSCQKRLEELGNANEELNENLVDQEEDALQVIAALHADNDKKNAEILELNQALKKAEIEGEKKVQKVRLQYEEKIADSMAVLAEKEAAFKIMQSEFAVIKDFRRKRQDLLKELEDSKRELEDTEARHIAIVSRMEKKFFSEKVRLQAEANEKIGELATQAHREAVVNLRSTTKDVFKENIRMSEALIYHVQAGEDLKKQLQKLQLENTELKRAQEFHQVIVKEKITKSKAQELEIRQLKEGLHAMEHSLNHVVQEFQEERKAISEVAEKELAQVKQVVETLTQRLAAKVVEMRHIKRLAQHILDQRTEMEEFFMDSLSLVKLEMEKDRANKLKTINENYKKSMKNALKPRAHIPTLKPLKPIKKYEIRDLLLPPTDESDQPLPAKVDIKDLSWEDRENILRILFAKMNRISLDTDSIKRESAKNELQQASKSRFTQRLSQDGIEAQ